MTKSKEKSVEKARRPAGGIAESTPDDGPSAWSRTVRETIESVVIAFVLAFLFRTFEAEAFVIPTGSMAPTLVGRHMDLKCPKCGIPFQVGTSDPDEGPPIREVHTCVCPNCRWEINFDRLADLKRELALSKTGEERAELEALVKQQDEEIHRAGGSDGHCPSYNGDRILVNKFAFDFTDPHRWDVIVFKYPEDAKTNYIKRLIGLSSEIIRIRDGDISVSRDGGKTFEMARKSPAKLRAMLQLVYDNDYVYEPFISKGWPTRWQSHDASWTYETAPSGSADHKALVTNGKAGTTGAAWLNYYNYVPLPDDWSAFQRGEQLRAPAAVQPIHDFIAYDASNSEMFSESRPVITDLAVEFQADVKEPTGKIALELVKKQQRFGCQLDLSNGAAELSIPGLDSAKRPRAKEGGISRAGSYTILFANVDHQLTLVVNNKQVQFDNPTTFDELSDKEDGVVNTDRADFSPAGIGSFGAALRVTHLQVLRDVYYTYIDRQNLPHPSYDLLGGKPPRDWPASNEWFCFPPGAVAKLRDAESQVRRHDQYFFVGDDQFFALGDNSPLSQDGRLWSNEHFIDRRLLVGKALFVYWPHSFDKIRISDEHSIPFPFFPNFGRMGFVR
ncbi:MAG TPA: signal peptidase I [Pirellulales bacterium]|nr:signal peptidase I [Pirellulales bacterium]